MPHNPPILARSWRRSKRAAGRFLPPLKQLC